MADELRRDCGATWEDLLLGKPSKPAWREPLTDGAAILVALRYRQVLTEWEAHFVRDINGRDWLSPKQRNVLARIVRKVRAFVCAQT